jgi:hypothetical protein
VTGTGWDAVADCETGAAGVTVFWLAVRANAPAPITIAATTTPPATISGLETRRCWRW